MFSQSQQCHPEQSRGIPWQNVEVISRDPSTPLRSARDDRLSVLGRAPSLIRHSRFVIRN